HRVEYGGSAFDDMTISAYAGPEYLLPRWQFDTLVTGFRRWHGNTPYSDGLGGRAAARFVATPQLIVGTALDFQAVTYRQVTEQNGSFFGVNADAAYIITPSSLVRLSGGIATQTAKVDSLANTREWVAFDYY